MSRLRTSDTYLTARSNGGAACREGFDYPLDRHLRRFGAGYAAECGIDTGSETAQGRGDPDREQSQKLLKLLTSFAELRPPLQQLRRNQ